MGGALGSPHAGLKQCTPPGVPFPTPRRGHWPSQQHGPVWGCCPSHRDLTSRKRLSTIGAHRVPKHGPEQAELFSVRHHSQRLRAHTGSRLESLGLSLPRNLHLENEHNYPSQTSGTGLRRVSTSEVRSTVPREIHELRVPNCRGEAGISARSLGKWTLLQGGHTLERL